MRNNAEGHRRGTASVTGIHPKASGFTTTRRRGEGKKKVRHTAGVNFNCQCKKWQERAGHP